MKNLVQVLTAMFAVLLAFDIHATDYYVDAVYGDDANSGLAAGAGNAKKSLMGVFALSPASGSVVHAAAGVYSNEVMTSGSAKYRAIVPAGVTLLGAGADVTVIEGAPDPGVNKNASPFGCGANAVRGVFLGNKAILRNFTLRNCHTPGYDDKDANMGGAVLSGENNGGYIVDCIITNNVGARAAGSRFTHAIRCFFNNNLSSTTGNDVMAGSAFNCIFGNCLDTGTYNVYQKGPYVNNTFFGSGKSAHSSSASEPIVLYNSIVLKVPNSNVCYTNCVVTTTSGTYGEGTVYYNSSSLLNLGENWRPLRGSPCIDAGNSTYYDKYPAAFADTKGIDILSNTRIIGDQIDVGACEAAFKGGAYNWYVNAGTGDDANDGVTAETAYKTLAAALSSESLAPGDIVNVAPGVYSNGSMTAASRNYRAVLPARVTLLGAGADATVIMGAADPDAASGAYGCGANALSGIYMNDGSVVRGVTITGCHTPAYDNSKYGGAIYGASSAALATAIDCIFTNNVAGRAAGGFQLRAIRCYFDNNRASYTASDIMNGSAFNCIFGNCLNTSSYNLYNSGSFVNNTFFGSGICAHSTSGPLVLYNCVVLKKVQDNVYYTNCVVTVTTGTYGQGTAYYSSSSALFLDENWRPTRLSPCIDAGDATYYDNKYPAAFAETKGIDYLSNTRIVGDQIDAGACEAAYCTSNKVVHLYVDADNGDDGNAGTSASAPYKTLAAALSNESLLTNDVVHVAAGVYSNGTIEVSGDAYRAAVPAGVKVIGAGADVTVIEGAADPDVAATSYGCGPKAIRGVYMHAGSILRGFTLRRCHSPSYDISCWGGAVTAPSGGYVIDCTITNNFAGRGAGMNRGTAIRCRFNGNGVNSSGTDIIQGSAFNCLFGDIVSTAQDNVYQIGPYVNCTFYGKGNVAHDAAGVADYIYNSIILKNSGTGTKARNCATTATSPDSYDEDSIPLTEAEMMLDGNFVPMKGSPLIDRGKASYYDRFPAAFVETLKKLDLGDGQRIYNGAIDIGAFEYDWRADYAKTLRRSRVSVVSAGESVTNATGCVYVPAGETLVCEWSFVRKVKDASFKVTPVDGGVATVLLDGVAIEPDANGIYTFTGTAGTVFEITISCTSGGVMASEFNGEAGSCIILR